VEIGAPSTSNNRGGKVRLIKAAVLGATLQKGASFFKIIFKD
jgi:hypothetical protein